MTVFKCSIILHIWNNYGICISQYICIIQSYMMTHFMTKQYSLKKINQFFSDRQSTDLPNFIFLNPPIIFELCCFSKHGWDKQTHTQEQWKQ